MDIRNHKEPEVIKLADIPLAGKRASRKPKARFARIHDCEFLNVGANLRTYENNTLTGLHKKGGLF